MLCREAERSRAAGTAQHPVEPDPSQRQRLRAMSGSGLDEGEDHRTALCAAGCVGKQEILSVNDERLHAALSPAGGVPPPPPVRFQAARPACIRASCATYERQRPHYRHLLPQPGPHKPLPC